jgi:hypothetical protein
LDRVSKERKYKERGIIMSKKDALNSLVAASVILAVVSKDNPYMNSNMLDDRYFYTSSNRGKGKGRNKKVKHWQKGTKW